MLATGWPVIVSISPPGESSVVVPPRGVWITCGATGGRIGVLPGAIKLAMPGLTAAAGLGPSADAINWPTGTFVS